MEIDKIIDEIEDIVDLAWQVPMLGGKILVDSNEISQSIRNLRLTLPREIIQAKNIVSDRTRIMENAQNECESVYKKAEEKVRAMVDEHEIVKNAKISADEILKDSQAKINSIKSQAIAYLDKVFLKIEESMSSNLSEIKNTRKIIHDNIKT
ncbi:MAG: ATPase [Oscillospiraceae bacterium]|nr:ATPase [Oscillospiraceae bacterium]